jgi:midasin (ATPase involved in ribosome maturation)
VEVSPTESELMIGASANCGPSWWGRFSSSFTCKKVHLHPQNIRQTTRTMRTSPNIIITGTPGVGKTTHCEQLASSTGLTHLNVNKVVKERDCEDGFDDELNSVIVDEDKVSH